MRQHVCQVAPAMQRFYVLVVTSLVWGLFGGLSGFVGSAVAGPTMELPTAYREIAEGRIKDFLRNPDPSVDAARTWDSFDTLVLDRDWPQPDFLKGLNIHDAGFTKIPTNLPESERLAYLSAEARIRTSLVWIALLTAYYKETVTSDLSLSLIASLIVAYEATVLNEVRALTAELAKLKIVTIDEGILVPFARVWATVPELFRSVVGEKLVHHLVSESETIGLGEDPGTSPELTKASRVLRQTKKIYAYVLAAVVLIDVVVLALGPTTWQLPIKDVLVGIALADLTIMGSFSLASIVSGPDLSAIPLRAEYRSYRSIREKVLRTIASQTDATKKLFAHAGCALRLLDLKPYQSTQSQVD